MMLFKQHGAGLPIPADPCAIGSNSEVRKNDTEAKSCELRDLAQEFGDLGSPALDLLTMGGYLGASDIPSGLYSYRVGGI